jgi:hypothetical protein
VIVDAMGKNGSCNFGRHEFGKLKRGEKIKKID